MTDPQRYEIRTIDEMHAIPLDKIDAFCEDLRSWLTAFRVIESELSSLPADLAMQITIRSQRDMFGWIDDGKHDMNVNVQFKVPSVTG